jgi:hypothetical protein
MLSGTKLRDRLIHTSTDLGVPMLYLIAAIAHLLIGLVGFIYWIRNADRLAVEDLKVAALYILTGPLIFPLGAIAWGDTGATLIRIFRDPATKKSP